MKPSLLLECLTIGIKKHHGFLMAGMPGIGKTDMFKESCRLAKAKEVIMHPIVSDETDFKGLPWKIEGKDTATFLPFGDLAKLVSAKGLTAVLMDDLGQARPSVQAAAMQLVLGGKINGIEVPNSVTFFAATNRKEDKAAVGSVIEPLKGRFHSIITVDPDAKDWRTWANAHGIFTPLISFVEFRPDLLYAFDPNTAMQNSPTPRNAAHVSDIMQAGYPPHAHYELVKGAVGEGFATEFMAFMDVFADMPDPKQIILDPKGAPVPNKEKPAVMYALCGALSDLADEKNFDNMVTYTKRIPKEFSVMFMVNTIQRKGEAISKTKAFNDWWVHNKDVLF